jgi:hypothetical protein
MKGRCRSSPCGARRPKTRASMINHHGWGLVEQVSDTLHTRRRLIKPSMASCGSLAHVSGPRILGRRPMKSCRVILRARADHALAEAKTKNRTLMQ